MQQASISKHGGPQAIPNLWHGASMPSMDALRRQAHFLALPPLADVVVDSSDPSTYRNVRQDTPLWRTLHEGVLTTSRMKYALGFAEPRAARLLRGKHMIDRSGWETAARHMLQPPASVRLGPQGAASPQAHNAASRQRCNAPPGDGLQPQAGSSSYMEAPLTEAQANQCLAMAMGGALAVRLAWGSTQEAAALHAVMHLFPGSCLEEAGFWQVDPAGLPASWGLQREQLPLLGASPDGIITHQVHLGASDLAQAARVRAADGDAAAARLLLRAAVAQVPCSCPRPGGPAAAAAPAMEAAAPGQVSASGSYVAAAAIALEQQVPTEQALMAALERQASSGAAAPGGPQPGGGDAGGAGEAEQAAAGGQLVAVREVVEVKNVCPFVFRHRRRGKGGQPLLSYATVDRGPARSVAPFLVPQLQLHMLATGCMSALLVSRSASRGVAAFRLMRDERYIRDMLTLASLLRGAAAEAAAGGAPLPNSADLFWGPPADGLQGAGEAGGGYAGFVKRTAFLARGAACVAVGDSLQGVAMPAASSRAFL